MSNVLPLPQRQGLTSSAARALTDTLKSDAEKLYTRLLSAYERGVHTALGYPSWAAYCKTEFGTSKGHASRLLNAGRIARAIEAEFPQGNPPTEKAARVLTPLLKQRGEKAVAQAWAKATERYGETPTAEQVQQTVEETSGRRVSEAKLTIEQQQFARALRNLQTQCEYVSAVLAGRKNEDKARTRRVLDIDEETRAEWNESIKTIDNAARQLRRRVTKGLLP